MYAEVQVKSIDKTKKMATFLCESEGKTAVLEPIDYYREPIFIVKKAADNNGYIIKGHVVPVTTRGDIKFVQSRAERKWDKPLKWHFAS